MKDPDLGRLEPVDLETAWDNEPAGFTPWLAEPENLRLLGDAVGCELELEALEMPVGSFRADIVCRDAGTGTRVLIENQLDRSDHGHLGQTFTYAAGLDAADVVWLAQRFTDEHRRALDWLNRIAGGAVRFFGLEIELWRIDGSRAAPRFNVVCGPSDDALSRGAARFPREESGHRGYWSGVLERLDSADGPVSGKRQPPDKRRMVFRGGRKGFDIVVTAPRWKSRLGVQLYIRGNDARRRFALLEAQKAEIERELGYALTWDERPRERACIVSLYLHGADPDNEADWPRQHDWIASHVNDIYRVFAWRVKTM